MINNDNINHNDDYKIILLIIIILLSQWVLHRRPGPVSRCAEGREFTKGGFSKGGFSNLCAITMLVLLSPPLLNPPLRTPERGPRESFLWERVPGEGGDQNET